MAHLWVCSYLSFYIFCPYINVFGLYHYYSTSPILSSLSQVKPFSQFWFPSGSLHFFLYVSAFSSVCSCVDSWLCLLSALPLNRQCLQNVFLLSYKCISLVFTFLVFLSQQPLYNVVSLHYPSFTELFFSLCFQCPVFVLLLWTICLSFHCFLSMCILYCFSLSYIYLKCISLLSTEVTVFSFSVLVCFSLFWFRCHLSINLLFLWITGFNLWSNT